MRALFIFRWAMETSERFERFVKGTSLGLQTHTFEHPLAYVVYSLWELKILEEIFQGRGTRYEVLKVSLPLLLKDSFCLLLEDARRERNLEVFLVYGVSGRFVESLNGKRSQFKEVY